jgi:hypothetical protein
LICSSCCGAKRRVEIACPDDCTYLTGAHAAGWEGRVKERDRDQRRIAPHVQDLSEAQAELFLAMLVGLGDMGRRQTDLDDRRLANALAALRKTVETRVHGVIYEHRADDARAQLLVPELAELLTGASASGQTTPLPDAEQLAVLKALDATVLGTLNERGEPRAFIDMAARLTAEALPATEAEPSRIVLA